MCRSDAACALTRTGFPTSPRLGRGWEPVNPRRLGLFLTFPTFPTFSRAYVHPRAGAGAGAHTPAHVRAHLNTNKLGRLGRLGRVALEAALRVPNLCPTSDRLGKELSMAGHMRDSMPLCAEIVDAFRDAGLLTNADIARGMKEGTFFCEEAGHQIGDQARRAGCRLRARHRHYHRRAPPSRRNP